jgi:hypothetical protein
LVPADAGGIEAGSGVCGAASGGEGLRLGEGATLANEARCARTARASWPGVATSRWRGRGGRSCWIDLAGLSTTAAGLWAAACNSAQTRELPVCLPPDSARTPTPIASNPEIRASTRGVGSQGAITGAANRGGGAKLMPLSKRGTTFVPDDRHPCLHGKPPSKPAATPSRSNAPIRVNLGAWETKSEASWRRRSASANSQPTNSTSSRPKPSQRNRTRHGLRVSPVSQRRHCGFWQ